MDLDEARAFLASNHRAVLATTRKNGRPQLSPVTVGVDGKGHVVISSREPAYKVRNVRRNPNVSLCALNDDFVGRWIQVDGTAEIVSLPGAMGPLIDYYRRIRGEHPDWDDYRAAMVRDRRVVIRIHIERAGPDREG